MSERVAYPTDADNAVSRSMRMLREEIREEYDTDSTDAHRALTPEEAQALIQQPAQRGRQ